ncbi:MAG: helix-turn-helix transcriptional regulator [Oscillospiraceae bacterium]|nr:helix-turn-helix transcriptional regulator [Oscillospiraceae bacterium]
MEIPLNRIKDLREDSDLTQEKLAKKLGYHTTTYKRWEENIHSIKLKDALIIADFYGVSLDYIAGRTNCKNINKCR